VKQVAGFSALTLDAAQSQISALIDETEKLHQEGVPGLLEGVARERAGEEAAQKGRLGPHDGGDSRDGGRPGRPGADGSGLRVDDGAVRGSDGIRI